MNAPTLIQLKTPAKKTSGNYIKKNDSICYQSFDLATSNHRFNHANHHTTYATAQIRVTLVIHSRTVNASINVHNCFLFTTFKCFIMLYKFIIILVSSCLEFLVCTRCLITSSERAVTHARIRITDIVGGATAMSFGKKEFAPGPSYATLTGRRFVETRSFSFFVLCSLYSNQSPFMGLTREVSSCFDIRLVIGGQYGRLQDPPVYLCGYPVGGDVRASTENRGHIW